MSTEAKVNLRYRWECTCCLASGEISFAPTTACDVMERSIADAHRHKSPQCPKLRYRTDRLEDEYVYHSTPDKADE